MLGLLFRPLHSRTSTSQSLCPHSDVLLLKGLLVVSRFVILSCRLVAVVCWCSP